MRVYYITPYSLRSVSGVSKVVTQLCKGLKKRNIHHLVISGRLEDEIEKDEDVKAIEIDVTKIANFKDIYLAIKMAGLLIKDRKKFDLLHLQSPHLPPMVCAIIGKILGKPIITTIHGKFPRPRSMIRRLFLWGTIKGTILFSDKITFVDGGAKKHYNIPTGVVIENGIDTQVYLPNPKLRKETRNNLGLSEDDVVLLFLGRLVAHKGIYDLLDAFSEVLSVTDRNMKLLIIGSGEVDKVKEKIGTLNLGMNALLLGKVDAVINYYCVADIFVLYTSPLEGLPITLLEASSCGLAIISTSVSGIPSLIKDRENGLLLEYGDKNGLIQAIKMMVADEGLRNQLGKNARKRIEERYNLERAVDKYIQLYGDMVENK